MACALERYGHTTREGAVHSVPGLSTGCLSDRAVFVRHREDISSGPELRIICIKFGHKIMGQKGPN